MRTLHPVALHETFVASGEYRYQRNGEPLNVAEQWTIHELAGSAWLYRVDEDGRDEDGLNILSEALISPGGKIERYNVQSFNPLDSEVKLFKADYSFNQGYVQIGRTIQGQEREYEEFKLMTDCAIYIKQTLFMGLTIRDVLARGSKAHVFSPQLISLEDNQVQKIIAQEVSTESLEVGHRTIAARKIQIADDVFYWLDDHDIPLRREYTHEGLAYVVTLANYAHR